MSNVTHKNLSIVIHAGAQQTLADTLRSLTQIEGFTFTAVEGHSHQSENDPFLSARDKVVGFVPRVRVDVLLATTEVSNVLATIKAQNNLNGQGIYWVTPVDQQGCL